LEHPDEENPEWTEHGVMKIGDTVVGIEEFRAAVAKKLGRPRSANPKEQVTLRLDADVVEHYRKTGRGWQTRINKTLRKAAHLPKNEQLEVAE
jgi:uncharacterized protein (DUF4415 family)